MTVALGQSAAHSTLHSLCVKLRIFGNGENIFSEVHRWDSHKHIFPSIKCVGITLESLLKSIRCVFEVQWTRDLNYDQCLTNIRLLPTVTHNTNKEALLYIRNMQTDNKTQYFINIVYYHFTQQAYISPSSK